jgi:hypothetical protein
VKWYGKYGRKTSQIVKTYGHYGRNPSRIVKRNGKFHWLSALPRHFIFIITLFISIIIFLTKVCHHFIFQIFPMWNEMENTEETQVKMWNDMENTEEK